VGGGAIRASPCARGTELVALKVDLILANNGTPAARAALTATHEIPIVAPAIGDPAATGLVQSFGHPAGNLTGNTNMATELYPKRLALLKEAAPEIQRVALLMNGDNPFSAEAVRLSEVGARSLGIQPETFDVRDSADFEKAFADMSRARAQAVVVGADILLQAGVKQLGGLALRYSLPLVAGYHAPCVLLAYNVDNVDLYHRAAAYVDKVLRGAKPGDLPIEQPTHFTIVIDLATARALGLTIPRPLLVRADEVIQ
jgi:putative tryptophan/tyrosine transport system substrate-binding protein